MNDFMLLVGQMSPKTQMPPSLYTSEPAQEKWITCFHHVGEIGDAATLRRHPTPNERLLLDSLVHKFSRQVRLGSQ